MNHNTHDVLRTRLLQKAGLSDVPKPKFRLSDLEKSEWSPRFEALMRNRLLMGALRYGTLEQKRHRKAPYDLMGAIKEKLRLHDETGNDEYLVDIANYCLLEFEIGHHPNKHFHALDKHHHHCKVKKPPAGIAPHT